MYVKNKLRKNITLNTNSIISLLSCKKAVKSKLCYKKKVWPGLKSFLIVNNLR